MGLCEAMECNPGFLAVEPRLADLDAEGVEKELIFPQRLFGLYMAGDFDLREEIFGCYNEHIAEVCQPGADTPVPGDDPELLGSGEGRGVGPALQGARRSLPDGADPPAQGRRRRGHRLQQPEDGPVLRRGRDERHPAVLPHRREHPDRTAGRGGHVRAHADAGLPADLRRARLRRRVRPSSRPAGGVRRRRHLLGGERAARRRHDLHALPHRDEPQARAPAELVLAQPLLRDVHDRPAGPGAPPPHRRRPRDVELRLPAPGIDVGLHAQRDRCRVRSDHRRDRLRRSSAARRCASSHME